MRDYTKAAIQLRDGYQRQQRNKYTEQSNQLEKYMQIVPNYETYLTPRQRDAVASYKNHFRISDVANDLKIEESTAQELLFGRRSKKTTGALGKLMLAHQLLTENGYYERLEKRKEMKRVK